MLVLVEWVLFRSEGNQRERNRKDRGSPRGLDSIGSLRSSSLTTFTPAVLASPVFAETAAPSIPTLEQFPAAIA